MTKKKGLSILTRLHACISMKYRSRKDFFAPFWKIGRIE
ncbi:hypothetical protein BSM4216_0478 [Bacillus smithii]|nr:hypothetical protein BSM4216_0478 [Bacillus smithii]